MVAGSTLFVMALSLPTRLLAALAVASSASQGCAAPGLVPDEYREDTDVWEPEHQVADLPPPGSIDPDDPCDGYDNDVDGVVDEGCYCDAEEVQSCFLGESDHAGTGACHWGTQSCNAYRGEFELGSWGACIGSGAPSPEICGNIIDEDCDGFAEPCPGVPDPVGTACHPGESEACYDAHVATLDVGVCVAGLRACDALGKWSACVGAVVPSREICGNAVDEDCDGADADC
jgi:hypothetical protein